MQALTIDAVDIETLHELGLLRRDVFVGMNASDVEKFGVGYDKKQNLASENYPSQQAVQRRVRAFAAKRGFAIRVGGNSTNKLTREGNVKYVCKQLHGQQNLVGGAQTERCPFYINAYGKDGV